MLSGLGRRALRALGLAALLGLGLAAPAVAQPPWPTVTVVETARVGYSSSTGQNVSIGATVITGGIPVTDGAVTFTVDGLPAIVDPVDASGYAEANVLLPSGFAAGSYTIVALYSGSGQFYPSAGTATLAVTPGATATNVAAATVAYSAASHAVSLTATVTSPGGPVNEGTVTFSVSGNPKTDSAPVDANGKATGSLTLPAGFKAGAYTLTATYGDSSNVNGGQNFAGSRHTATFTVSPSPTPRPTRVPAATPRPNATNSQSPAATASAGPIGTPAGATVGPPSSSATPSAPPLASPVSGGSGGVDTTPIVLAILAAALIISGGLVYGLRGRGRPARA